MSKREKELRKLQLCELEILKDIVKICDKHNLVYYMMGGTFLGAIRHKGFIPWDDDIDISLNRDDYEKLFEILEKELPNKYVIDNFYKNDKCITYASRIENPNIKINERAATVEQIRNAWIDVFPLDGMPNNYFVRKIHQLRLLYLRMMFRYSTFSLSVVQNKKHRPLHEKILVYIGNHTNIEKKLNSNKCLKRLDKSLKKYKYKNSKYVVNFMGAYSFKEMFKKEIYDNYQKYQFEDTMLNAPKDYDTVLTQMYGDYMKLPDDSERNKHCTEMME